MLRHLLTTTSESEIQDRLAKMGADAPKTFVLSSRVPNDEAHIRYDVFFFVKKEDN